MALNYGITPMAMPGKYGAITSYGRAAKHPLSKRADAEIKDKSLDALVEKLSPHTRALIEMAEEYRTSIGKDIYGKPNGKDIPPTIPFGEGVILMYFGNTQSGNYVAVDQYLPGAEYNKN